MSILDTLNGVFCLFIHFEFKKKNVLCCYDNRIHTLIVEIRRFVNLNRITFRLSAKYWRPIG